MCRYAAAYLAGSPCGAARVAPRGLSRRVSQRSSSGAPRGGLGPSWAYLRRLVTQGLPAELQVVLPAVAQGQEGLTGGGPPGASQWSSNGAPRGGPGQVGLARGGVSRRASLRCSSGAPRGAQGQEGLTCGGLSRGASQRSSNEAPRGAQGQEGLTCGGLSRRASQRSSSGAPRGGSGSGGAPAGSALRAAAGHARRGRSSPPNVGELPAPPTPSSSYKCRVRAWEVS